MSYVKQEQWDTHMEPKDNVDDGNYNDYLPQSTQSAQNPITAFLAKLWALVNDSSCDDLIAWDPSGGSFHVFDQSRFSREILPRYFKHNNFASFIRQLNMYGFRKISTIEQGSLKNERDDIEFAHQHFIRGQESLLELIKRRAPDTQQKSNAQGGLIPSSALVSANYLDSKSGRPMEFVHLLDDVRNLQTKQSALSDKLSYMQTENQALWGEVGSLRQKHSKQQQVVSKLMEFLLHLISNNSSHSHGQSVEQHAPTDGITTDLLHPKQNQTQHHTISASIGHDQSSGAHKRKQAALTHYDESNKRTASQQQSFSHPTNLGRQQSVTINELTDNDTGGWAHTTDTSPLVDLVPSPPLPSQSMDDNYQQQQQQQQQNDFLWSNATNEHLHPSDFNQPNQAFRTVASEHKAANAYEPDFFLRADNTNGTNLTGIKPTQSSPSRQVPLQSSLKEEQMDFPNAFQPLSVDDLKTSPLSNPASHSQQHKIGQPTEQLSFSLDDITGDVDHIQSSLDNMRELLFDSLPDGTTIEDLFGENSELLSPLLQSAANGDPTANLILETLQEQKPSLDDNTSKPTETLPATTTAQALPDVNTELLGQWINEVAKVEEQQNTIDQLARDKSNLEDKVHLLEQQATKRL